MEKVLDCKMNKEVSYTDSDIVSKHVIKIQSKRNHPSDAMFLLSKNSYFSIMRYCSLQSERFGPRFRMNILFLSSKLKCSHIMTVDIIMQHSNRRQGSIGVYPNITPHYKSSVTVKLCTCN
jgi:hypothetical protein